jgi:alanine racemase
MGIGFSKSKPGYVRQKMKFRSRLVVNLQSLADNVSEIRKITNSEIIFMVKADGYGHGMIPLTRFACTELGIKEFGCASLAEALKLREELSDLEFEIYVFSDTQFEVLENAEIYLKHRIMPVISNISELDYLLHTREFKNLPICLKFNTGMNRLGLEPEDTPAIINKLKQHGRTSVHHLFTHFANASFSMEDDKRNQFQRGRFAEIKKFFQDSGIILERTSQSNSGAIEQSIGLKENSGDTHIRPGLMMYGPTSLSADLSSAYHGKIISSLETYILKTFEIKKGEPVGYNSTPVTSDGIIAVLAIGYGDGFSTRYSGANLSHKGFTGQIVGRVNMDMIQVLFPIEAKGVIAAQDVFVIWGEQEGDLLRFSEETKTIPYEIFCALLPRVPRVYRLD